MLHRPATSASYLKASGQIDMAHVMREAHRRVRALRETYAKRNWDLTDSYATLFRNALVSELATAKIKRCAWLDEQRGSFPEMDTRVSTFGGVTFHEQIVGGHLVNVGTP